MLKRYIIIGMLAISGQKAGLAENYVPQREPGHSQCYERSDSQRELVFRLRYAERHILR